MTPLLLAATVLAAETLVYDLPQGGELLVLPVEGADGVIAGILIPEGWATAGMESFAKLAWERKEDVHSDLLALSLQAPGWLSVHMAPGHALTRVSGAAISPEFTALVDAGINRAAPWRVTWTLSPNQGLNLQRMLRETLTDEEPPPPVQVDGSELGAVVARLNRHPDRVFFVAGAVTPEEAVALANEVLPTAREDAAPVIPPRPQWPDEVVTLQGAQYDATWQVWAWPSIDSRASTAPAARLLWAVLVQRTEEALRRQRGLTYGVLTSAPIAGAGDISHIAVSSAPEKAAAARQLVEETLASLGTEPMTEAELEGARQVLLSDLTADYTSVSSLALTVALDRLHTGQWTPLTEQVSALTAVTHDEIQALARRWLLDGPQARVVIDGTTP